MICAACHYPIIGHFSRGGFLFAPDAEPFEYLGQVTKQANAFKDGQSLMETTAIYACPQCGTIRKEGGNEDRRD